MSNLIKFTKAPSFEYDWSQIDDLSDRYCAKSALNTYKKSFEERREQANDLIQGDTRDKAQCVYAFKLSLDHGYFIDACQEALGLDSRTASAYASVGQKLSFGDEIPDVLELVNQMEPRAANRFLKSDDEVKSDYVVRYQETGHIPSQRDFVKSKPIAVTVESTPYVASEPIDVTPIVVSGEIELSPITASVEGSAIDADLGSSVLYRAVEAFAFEKRKRLSDCEKEDLLRMVKILKKYCGVSL